MGGGGVKRDVGNVDSYQGKKCHRDTHFQEAERVRSEERGGLGPRNGPSGVQKQRHSRGPVKCVTLYKSDIQKIL